MAELKCINIGPFNGYMAQAFEQYILEVENSNQPYFVFKIDSPGGAVFSLNKMYNLIHQSNKPTVAICESMAASCGSIIFGLSDYRIIGPNSQVLIHEPSTWSQGKINDIKSDINMVDGVRKWMFDSFDKRCKQESGFFENLVYKNNNADLWLNADKCLEYGIADEIGAINSFLRMSDKEILDKCKKYKG